MESEKKDSGSKVYLHSNPMIPKDMSSSVLVDLVVKTCLGTATMAGFGQIVDPSTQLKLRELEGKITELKSKVDAQVRTLRQEQLESDEKTNKIAELENNLLELRTKQKLDFLLNRVNAEAQSALLNSPEFQDRFLSEKECDAFVMSVDIRRSTELMLKARSAENFASFINDLCSQLISNITSCYGVFDKFTGDGVLAFFPDFYSGPDAGYYAVTAAMRCHETFQSHYKRCRKSFSSILTDVGLGIGIDYGHTHLLQIAGGLTVVGVPVVYACRLAGAPPGRTYLNQPSYEKVCERSSAAFLFSEEMLEIKHEGSILAYNVKPSGFQASLDAPPWLDKGDLTALNRSEEPKAQQKNAADGESVGA